MIQPRRCRVRSGKTGGYWLLRLILLLRRGSHAPYPNFIAAAPPNDSGEPQGKSASFFPVGSSAWLGDDLTVAQMVIGFPPNAPRSDRPRYSVYRDPHKLTSAADCQRTARLLQRYLRRCQFLSADARDLCSDKGLGQFVFSWLRLTV